MLALHRKFPLAGCKENQRIFGAVHRHEASRKALLKQSFTFALTTGTFALSGRAAVTSVSQEEIKLQLLAGKRAFNFDSTNADNGEEQYIDELPLDYMTQRIHSKAQEWINANMQEFIDGWRLRSELRGKDNTLPALLFSKALTARERSQFMFGSSDDTDCVFFPIFSEEDELWSNWLDFRYWGDDIYMGDSASPRHTWRNDMETYFFRLKAGKTFPLPHTAAPGAYLFQKLKDGEASWQDYAAVATASLGMISAIASSFANLYQAEQRGEEQAVEQRYDKEIEKAGQNTKKGKKLEEEKQKELAKIKNKYNSKAMSMEIAQAVASTAMAVINAYTSAAQIPLIGHIVTPIAAGMALAVGAVQIAAIKKQHAAQASGYYVGAGVFVGERDGCIVEKLLFLQTEKNITDNGYL